MIPYLILGIALVGTLIASYTDVKIREVSNWVSFGLVFAMLGLRVLYAFTENSFSALWTSLIAGGLFLTMGMVFFYSRQMGGADVKMLTAMGIGFGAMFPEFTPMFVPLWPFFLTILLNFLLVSIAWSLIYAFHHTLKTPAVGKDFKASWNKYEVLILSSTTFASIVVGFYITELIWLFLFPLLWILSKFLKAVEKNCMFKIRSVNELVEFDIPEKDIKVGKRVIVSSKDPNGITLENLKEIKRLTKKGKLPKKIKVMWGVPLVPVFLITILLSISFGDLMFALIAYLVN
jgi:Flp pilus assembly protein protease CpaA